MKADGSVSEDNVEVDHSQVFSTHVLAMDKGNGRCIFQCIAAWR